MHALRLGLRPHAAVGDFDSVSSAVLARCRRQWPDVIIRRHPADKAQSDLDLALSFAWGLDPTSIAILSGGGGRLDHLLSGISMLGRPRYAALPITAYVGDSVVRTATVGMELPLNVTDGNLLTLLAIGGSARLLTTGLRWNLTPTVSLRSAATLGLSNELTGPTAGLVICAGSILAIQTHGDSLG
ncbi:thiamine diphosphokinase [Candidatus Poriferisodalis sp.]|uniref:thiamine diphosphokinase n=1 Tax=Candidatus Poriferisodalis sp. TaxID=3101277 RepID=UPI003B01E25B